MLLKYDFSEEQLGIKKSSRLDIRPALEELNRAFPLLDAIILTSKDPFISEYVPLSNNCRYGITGFTGSVGDAVYWGENFRKRIQAQTGVRLKPVSLFVDGRYHLQADRETASDLVEVVKVDVEPNIEASVCEQVFSHSGLQVGMVFERTSFAAIQQRQDKAKHQNSVLVNLSSEAVLKAVHLSGWNVDRPIFSLKEENTGRTIARTLRAMTQDLHSTAGTHHTLHITAATDDAAFLLNARGFHLPSTASFLAYTFLAGNELLVFLPSGSAKCQMQLDESQFGEYRVTVIRNDVAQLKDALIKHKVEKIHFNGAWMNGYLPTFAKEIFPRAEMVANYTWLLRNRTRKTPQEMNAIRTSFLRSSRAIAKTLRWGKSESQSRNVSEVDLAKYLYQSYGDEGAVGLSFNTISGAGANSAIVHYSTPSPTTYFEKGDLALLDSGAYYAEGFCTDCTRGFFVGDQGSAIQPSDWQRDIYTATLKSAIQVFLRPVDASLSGREVDAMIRGEVKKAGYDYLHGTGHGIGIHVHEEGIRLSTMSIYPQSPFACVSVEPGIYLQGKGGVRVENVALLNPEDHISYRYENVVFVGYDWDLIDVSRLTDAEKSYLKDYEAKCRELGNHLMECPL